MECKNGESPDKSYIAPLTCLTCRVFFPCENGNVQKMMETQKSHHQSDWHRFNLNRKVAGQPAVSLDVFNERLLLKKNEATEEKPTSCYCAVCKKRFSTAKTFEEHKRSNKHIQAGKLASKLTEVGKMTQINVEKSKVFSASTDKDDLDEDMEEEEVSDEEWNSEPLPVNACLFCSCVNKDLDENIEHMNHKHSFFIPDIEYVSDLCGLMTYLGEKVGSFHVCLWCNKTRRSGDVRAVQQHMMDKGHNKIYFESEALIEFADFYDYRKSYPDFRGGDDEDNKDDDDDGDEMVGSSSDLDLNDHNFQLKLPSGAIIGHRQLLRYYKQKLRPGRQIAVHNNSSSIAKAILHYKKLGWTGTTGSAALARAKDIAYVHKFQSKHFMKLGIKSNKLQRHFRDQNFGF
ncbi:hypothetical protein HELRODRAFT_107851 [Helobdella robusta]|uniref:C2H2-type domain-containing protein n=1 Tax=Helobdella robusta TaxID=6412 RepID=T1EED3_HELRO|nr:hypothetical protein HELRODRAFT_107851 [Helobdella robusta]ESN94585.1 hypothetical protein HELRODRAFT_107851 [Helobdella robusta]